METSLILFKQREKLKELKEYRGRGTELISVYVKPQKQISEVVAKLREEWTESSNIKSDTTRNNVQDALMKIIQKLKFTKTSGKKGLAIFCGYIDEYGWIQKIIIPMSPILINLYQCDDHFHIEYLEGLLESKEIYGLVLVDSQKATVALLRGNNLEILDNLTSGIEGKHGKGGQSQRRFERQRDERVKQFFKRVANHVNNSFLKIENLKGILVGGCAFTKDDWIKAKYLDYRLERKILSVENIGYSDYQGLKELISKSKEILKETRYVQEEELVESFLYEIGKDSGLAIYGEEYILKELKNGKLRLLLLSESIGLKKINELSKIATSSGTLVEIVSMNHESGQKLEKSFHGIAGISYY